MLIKRFEDPVPLTQIKDVALSQDYRLLAFRNSENALALITLERGLLVNGFKPQGILFYEWIYVGKTLLATINSRGSIIIHEYRKGKTSGRGFYARVVSKISIDAPNDPVLVKFDDNEDSEGDETIHCFEVPLDRLSALIAGKSGPKERIVAVVRMFCVSGGRHLVLVLKSARADGAVVAVMDVTSRLICLRRWWMVDAGDASEVVVDPDVVVGRKEVPGLIDVGPRALGTDLIQQEPILTEMKGLHRPWIPRQHVSVSVAATEGSENVPSGLIAVSSPDAQQARLFLGSDGLFAPCPDRLSCLKATVIFQGQDKAFEVALANNWDKDEVRIFLLELAFRFNDAEGAKRALRDLTKPLRARAREIVNSCMPLKWSLSRVWASCCILWASDDGDVEAAASVKQSRTNAPSSSLHQAPTKSNSSTPVRRGLFSETWKPKRSARLRWDGKSDEEIARSSCLEGNLCEAYAFVRWRGSFDGPMQSMVALAKEAAYVALCKGSLDEAKIMIANAGGENVEEILKSVHSLTLRPDIRNVTGRLIETTHADELIAKLGAVYNCRKGPVDDHPDLSKWIPETPGDVLMPTLRTSVEYVNEWNDEGVEDLLLEAAIWSGKDISESWEQNAAKALSFLCRHGHERQAKKLGAILCERGLIEVFSTALVDAAPHAERAVLWECARHGIHPLGLNVRTACAVGAMLKTPDAGRICVKTALSLRRAAMIHALMDAGAVASSEDLASAGAWGRLVDAVRQESVSVHQIARECALVLHGSMINEDQDIRILGRPLISVLHDIYASGTPVQQELAAIGCLVKLDSPHIVESSVNISSLIPEATGKLSQQHSYIISQEQWFRRKMPFRGSAADSEESMLQVLSDKFPKQHAPNVADNWLLELLESSLDVARPVTSTNPHVNMVINRHPFGGMAFRKDFGATSLLPTSFLRAWVHLRMRMEARSFASNVSEAEGRQLLEECIKSQTRWDVAHLLRSLAHVDPVFALMLENWNVITTHALEMSLLNASKERMGDALRHRGLWDAARHHDPERKDFTTLMQAERIKPNWTKIVVLFDRQSLAQRQREKFWISSADELDHTAPVELLACATKSCTTSNELEARLALAETIKCSWTKFKNATTEAKIDILRDACGVLASGLELDRAIDLCKYLNLWPDVVSLAQRPSLAIEDLEEFISGKYGFSWIHWAQGKVLRIRASVSEAVSPESVITMLAGEGQVALARDWANHFRPDCVKLSRALASRFIEALRSYYTANTLPSSLVSLASPSSRGILSAPGIDISWSDGAWADYVAIGGSPRDVGDVLLEALRTDQSQLVRAVELCVRAYSCYAMACNVDCMNQVLDVAVKLAHTLGQQGLYQHLVRLVTGVGNYGKLEFCFGMLLEAQQFELILRKNPMMSYGARLELRLSLWKYLKKERPDDERTLNLLMLSYGMYREIGDALEAKANDMIQQGKGRNSLLLKAMGHLIDAADAFHKERCLQSAERVLCMAQLVKLQIQKPLLRLLYDKGADIGKLSNFSEALIVAKALDFPQDWWVVVVSEQVLLGNMAYLETATSLLVRTSSVATVFHDILTRCKASNATTAQLTAVVSKCPDIFLAFDLSMEFGLTDAADDAAKHSAIRAFKLLHGRKNN